MLPIFFQERIVDVAVLNLLCCSKESGQWLENVDQTYLALAIGKLVVVVVVVGGKVEKFKWEGNITGSAQWYNLLFPSNCLGFISRHQKPFIISILCCTLRYVFRCTYILMWFA